jgi:hypothetical protein
LESGADYLPNVLEAFEQFLRQAGFTYIELLADGESDGSSSRRPPLRLGRDFDDETPLLRTRTTGTGDAEEDEPTKPSEAYERRPTKVTYYDPFTRDVDYSKFLADLPKTIKVGDKVRVVRR